MGEEGRDARGEELLAVAAADDQRALLAGADQQPRLLGGDGHERVMAAEPVVGAARRLDQPVVVEIVGDQVRDHLDVGLRAELGARGQKLLLELHVVLDDPVDHDVDAVFRVVVRVGVLLGHATVGRPAGVPDAGGGRRGHDGDASAAAGLERRLQLREVADGTDGIDRPSSAWIEMPAES